MKRLPWAILLLAVFLIPATAQAQTTVSVGPKAGFGLGDIEEPYIGADVRIGFDAPIRINPKFDYYFAPENVTYWSAGANALFDFPVDDSPVAPFVGGGVQILNTSIDVSGDFGSGSFSSTDLGLSGVGGAEFNLDGIRPFVQGELGIIFSEGDSGTLFGISGGVLFDL
ncbi:MAG: outer membrane beta-barrel protein [Longimonas sp.]|uniref:outer membrane protein n=1 Tax=Longimonas sp. TaxID=2039626 RepID=UPI0039770927